MSYGVIVLEVQKLDQIVIFLELFEAICLESTIQKARISYWLNVLLIWLPFKLFSASQMLIQMISSYYVQQNFLY